jgi:hypothetical protein
LLQLVDDGSQPAVFGVRQVDAAVGTVTSTGSVVESQAHEPTNGIALSTWITRLAVAALPQTEFRGNGGLDVGEFA